MRLKTNQRLIVEDYCKLHPKIRDLTLAKKIYTENTKEFKSIEYARGVVRKVRGHKGKRDREVTTDKTMFTPTNYNTTVYKPYKSEEAYGKILVLDIETAPIRAYVWDIWNQNIGINQIESDWFCLTWSAKWLFESKVHSARLTGKEAIKQDDKRIIKSLWLLLNEADIVIAHNGDKFDIPRINSRFIIHRLNPPLPYQSIDTLKHIRRQFGFVSNKLDYVNKLLNLTRKADTGGFELWEKCYKGDEKSLVKMEKYNIKDVKILEETYLRIRAWIKPHPNLGLFILDDEKEHCPSCGSDNIQKDGIYRTYANNYEAFRCGNCGAVGRMRKSSVTVNERRRLTLSIPK